MMMSLTLAGAGKVFTYEVQINTSVCLRCSAHSRCDPGSHELYTCTPERDYEPLRSTDTTCLTRQAGSGSSPVCGRRYRSPSSTGSKVCARKLASVQQASPHSWGLLFLVPRSAIVRTAVLKFLGGWLALLASWMVGLLSERLTVSKG